MIYVTEINKANSNWVDEIDKLVIPCPICNRMYHRVAAHAKAKHGISIQEFKETFHYTTATQACAYQLLRLYGGRSDRYIEQIYKGRGTSTYITIDGNDPCTPAWDKFIGIRKAVAHLRGTKTYGVLFWDYHTKVIVFDIDFYHTSPDNQELYIKRLFSTLEKLNIPRQCIHVLKSGLKGYHIDLYFENWMPTQALLRFAELTSRLAGLDELEPYVKVEFRPEKPEGGRGVRLPLGVHTATGERMLYLKPDFHLYHEPKFQPVQDQLHYLLYQTRQISREDFFSYTYPLIREKEQILNQQARYYQKLSQLDLWRLDKRQTKGIISEKAAIKEKEKKLSFKVGSRRYTREELDDFYLHGLSSYGTRHNVTLGLAIRLKEQGHSQKEVRQLLYEWSRKKAHYTQSTLEERIEDVNAIVRYVFENDCHLDEPSDAEWLLTDSDLLTILNYHYLTLAEQKTLAIIFMIRRHFGKDAYYPQELIARLASVDARTVRNHITKFRTLSILRLTYRGNSFSMHSNKYEIRDFKEDYSVAFAFKKATVSGETFIKAMKGLVSEKFIVARYSDYLRRVRIKPVEKEGYTVKVHPDIPSPVTIETPKIEFVRQQENPVGRKILEYIIAIFRLVRFFKRKHGAILCKKIFRDIRYYMKC